MGNYYYVHGNLTLFLPLYNIQCQPLIRGTSLRIGVHLLAVGLQLRQIMIFTNSKMFNRSCDRNIVV